MDEDCTDAAWAQLECERRQREDELISRLRKEYGSFRAECDAFTAEFNMQLQELKREHQRIEL